MIRGKKTVMKRNLNLHLDRPSHMDRNHHNTNGAKIASQTGTVRSNTIKRKEARKTSVFDPLKVDWPYITSTMQNQILHALVEYLESWELCEYRRSARKMSKSSKSRHQQQERVKEEKLGQHHDVIGKQTDQPDGSWDKVRVSKRRRKKKGAVKEGGDEETSSDTKRKEEKQSDIIILMDSDDEDATTNSGAHRQRPIDDELEKQKKLRARKTLAAQEFLTKHLTIGINEVTMALEEEVGRIYTNTGQKSVMVSVRDKSNKKISKKVVRAEKSDLEEEDNGNSINIFEQYKGRKELLRERKSSLQRMREKRRRTKENDKSDTSNKTDFSKRTTTKSEEVKYFDKKPFKCPIGITFVCRRDIDPPMLVNHLPNLVGNLNALLMTTRPHNKQEETVPPIKSNLIPTQPPSDDPKKRKREEDGGEGEWEGEKVKVKQEKEEDKRGEEALVPTTPTHSAIYLVSLDQGASVRLAKCLGVRTCAALSLSFDAPYCEKLYNLIQSCTSAPVAPWLASLRWQPLLPVRKKPKATTTTTTTSTSTSNTNTKTIPSQNQGDSTNHPQQNSSATSPLATSSTTMTRESTTATPFVTTKVKQSVVNIPVNVKEAREVKRVTRSSRYQIAKRKAERRSGRT